MVKNRIIKMDEKQLKRCEINLFQINTTKMQRDEIRWKKAFFIHLCLIFQNIGSI